MNSAPNPCARSHAGRVHLYVGSRWSALTLEQARAFRDRLDDAISQLEDDVAAAEDAT